MTNLFIGNLSWSTTDESLRAFFAQVGEVSAARVVMDRMSGRSRGFGFVEMPNAEEAKKAIEELNGKDLDGREIRVNEAMPKTEGGNGAARRPFNNDRGGNRDNGGNQNWN